MLGHLFSASAPVSGTGTGFGPIPSRERGIRMVVWLVVAPRCGYCLKASMTGDGWLVLSCCYPLIPVSGTGTGLSFLSHQGRGGLVVGLDQLTS